MGLWSLLLCEDWSGDDWRGREDAMSLIAARR